MKPIVIKASRFSVTIDDEFIDWASAYFFKGLFIIFIYFGFFSRKVGMGGLTGGMTAVLVGITLFMFVCLHMFYMSKSYKISFLSILFFLFFLYIALTPLFSAFIYNERLNHIFRLSIEIGILFFMFFSMYYLIKEKIISPRFFIYTIAIIGALASIVLLSNMIGQVRVGRIRGFGALNYTGISFAATVMAWMMIIMVKNYPAKYKSLYYAAMILTFFAMFFTGTRQAVVALLVGVTLFQLFGMQSNRFKRYILWFFVLLTASILIIAVKYDITALIGRYTIDSLSYMVDKRMSIYFMSISDLTAFEFLIGRPDLAVTEDGLLTDSRYINTHNIFLSLIRYNGILSFVFFAILLIIIWIKYYRVFLNNRKKPAFRMTEASIIIFLVVTFINLMLSGGKYTRTFSFFIFLGYAVGYFDLLRKVKSEDEYKKMIL